MDFQELPVLHGDEELDPRDLLTIRAVLSIFERNAAITLCKRLIALCIGMAITVIIVITIAIAILYTGSSNTRACDCGILLHCWRVVDHPPHSRAK